MSSFKLELSVSLSLIINLAFCADIFQNNLKTAKVILFTKKDPNWSKLTTDLFPFSPTRFLRNFYTNVSMVFSPWKRYFMSNNLDSEGLLNWSSSFKHLSKHFWFPWQRLCSWSFYWPPKGIWYCWSRNTSEKAFSLRNKGYCTVLV